jgi:hypothetical protein
MTKTVFEVVSGVCNTRPRSVKQKDCRSNARTSQSFGALLRGFVSSPSLLSCRRVIIIVVVVIVIIVIILHNFFCNFLFFIVSWMMLFNNCLVVDCFVRCFVACSFVASCFIGCFVVFLDTTLIILISQSVVFDSTTTDWSRLKNPT